MTCDPTTEPLAIISLVISCICFVYILFYLFDLPQWNMKRYITFSKEFNKENIKQYLMAHFNKANYKNTPIEQYVRFHVRLITKKDTDNDIITNFISQSVDKYYETGELICVRLPLKDFDLQKVVPQYEQLLTKEFPGVERYQQEMYPIYLNQDEFNSQVRFIFFLIFMFNLLGITVAAAFTFIAIPIMCPASQFSPVVIADLVITSVVVFIHILIWVFAHPDRKELTLMDISAP
jgi:hypothetical protein